MFGFDTEEQLEAEVRRVVGRLEALSKGTQVAREEHCNLLQDFERLLELKLQLRGRSESAVEPTRTYRLGERLKIY